MVLWGMGRSQKYGDNVPDPRCEGGDGVVRDGVHGGMRFMEPFGNSKREETTALPIEIYAYLI
jgi:hypothetical protein